jgi:hypothetical protein
MIYGCFEFALSVLEENGGALKLAVPVRVADLSNFFRVYPRIRTDTK